MHGFKPYLISGFPRNKASCGSRCHEFPSGVVGSQSFFSSFIESGQSFFQCREEGFSQRGVRAWFITVKEGERRCLSGAMWGRVMVEFGRREELHPFSRVVGAEDMEISLEFLVGSLSLSVGLRMVCGGESYVIVEEAC